MAYQPKFYWPKIKKAHERAPHPYGYMVHFANPKYSVIDPLLIEVMETALLQIDGGESFKKVSEWLGQQTGKPLSQQGMSDIWWRIRGNDPKNQRAIELKAQKKARKPKTPREQAESDARQKLAGAIRSVKAREKKLKGIITDRPKVVETAIEKYFDQEQKLHDNQSEIEKIPSFVQYVPTPEEELQQKDPLAGKNVLFQPHPGPQTTFLASTEQEVLYGGAAGGGKSYALIADPVRYFDNPNFNGIIVRRTNDELRELKMKSLQLYTGIYGKDVRWKEKDSTYVFPSGAQLWFTYLEQDKDVLRYQGQAFCYIAFDELTQYSTPFAWNYMRSRLRTTDPNLPLYMRATTNPGGPGHGWVKRMFIDPAPYGEAFPATDIDTGKVLEWPPNDPKGRSGPLFQRRFIPAKLSDNPSLYEDGQYEANLRSLSENEQRKLLEGDWTVADGAAFSEYRESMHTCKPFEIPDTWRKFRSCDYGYSSFSAVHWFAIDPAYETLVVYRELYVSKHTGVDLAAKIMELEYGDNISYGVLDSSVWAMRGQVGPSVAEDMIRSGVRFRPADRAAGSREAGLNRMHEVMKIDESIPHYDEGKMGRPGIVFFNTCRQIISDLPVIPMHPDGKDDIDDRYTSDHTYDSIRYGVMSRPKPNHIFGDMGFNTTDLGYRPASKKFGY